MKKKNLMMCTFVRNVEEVVPFANKMFVYSVNKDIFYIKGYVLRTALQRLIVIGKKQTAWIAPKIVISVHSFTVHNVIKIILQSLLS